MKFINVLAFSVFIVWAVVVGISLWTKNYTVLGVVTPIILTVIGYYFSKNLNGNRKKVE
jgi:hypothetical protein